MHSYKKMVVLYMLIQLCVGAKFKSTNHITALDDYNFESITNSYDSTYKRGWMILFYNSTAPCSFCDEAYDSMEAIGGNFNETYFGVIESETSPDTFRRFRLKEKSQMLFIRKGKYYLYNKDYSPERLQ